MTLRQTLTEYNEADTRLRAIREQLSDIFDPILHVVIGGGAEFTTASPSPTGDNLTVEYKWDTRDGDWDYIDLPLEIVDAADPLAYAKAWDERRRAANLVEATARRLRDAEQELERAKAAYQKLTSA